MVRNLMVSIGALLQAHPDDVKRLAAFVGVTLPAKRQGERSDLYRLRCASKVFRAISKVDMFENIEEETRAR